jgi:dipeptidyl aminopeptidase/acylaminoacyl peptidase
MRNAAVILSSDDIMLSGEVFMPDECNKTFPAVLLCHGIPAARYDPNEKGGYPALAARICQAGFVAMAFSFRGCGTSQGNLDMLGWTHDLASAVEFLHMLPEVDKDRLCLLGSSGGAAVCTYVAARDQRARALATFACPAEFDFMSSGFNPAAMINSFRDIGTIRDADFPPSIEKWMDGFTQVAPIKYIDKITPRPLLLVHGDHDLTVPVEHAKRLYEKAGQPKELVIIPEAGHRLRQDERAVEAAIKWLTKTVKV